MERMAIMTETRCFGCMSEKGGNQVCRNCGWEEPMPPIALYLRPGTIFNDQYLVGRVLGKGGFGITYIGWDTHLNMRLAIKEYIPGQFVTREPGSSRVTAYDIEARETFEYGLEQFKEEARALARFNDHPGVVKVLNFFNDDRTGTAYIVMAYLDGKTLKDYLTTNGEKMAFEEARDLLMRVMDTLREVHSHGMLHRDISPDNIFITRGGLVKLIDFGAARYAIGEHSKTLSLMLKHGYAPFEQYSSKGQGAATDIYALAATFYRAITGETPPLSTDRKVLDELKPPSQFGIQIPGAAESALMKALAVRYEDRFQDVGSFQRAMAPMREEGGADGQEKEKPERKLIVSRLKKWRVAFGVLLFVTLGLGISWLVASQGLHKQIDTLQYKLQESYNEGSYRREEVQKKLNELQGSVNNLIDKNGDRQVSIVGVRLRNYHNDSWIGDYSTTFTSGGAYRIAYTGSIRNNWPGIKNLKGILTAQYVYPNNLEARDGTYTQEVDTRDGVELKPHGWGYEGLFPAGTYHIKFFWQESIWSVKKEISDVAFVVTP